ncbi:MAG: hypothetical protein Tsb0020_47560 [Haliangiales bacterium]
MAGYTGAEIEWVIAATYAPVGDGAGDVARGTALVGVDRVTLARVSS